MIAVPATVSATSESPLDDVRLAKIGLAAFLVDNVDRPLHVTDPCPTLTVEAAAQVLAEHGLTPSARPSGSAVVFDDIGGGLVAARCGVDLARSPDPVGSSALSIDVAMLDGQASFAQIAVDVGGRDVQITDIAITLPAGETPAQVAARCTNGGQDCTVVLGVGGLVVVVRLDDLPRDNAELLARGITGAVAPVVITNLAAIGSTRVG